MKEILKHTIEINHLSYAEAFRDSVRKDINFHNPLYLNREPSFFSTENGDLLLVSEYISWGIENLLLNMFYVHKYINSAWVEILAIPHAKNVKVYDNLIYAIIELEEGQYDVTQYDTNGQPLRHCILENEPDTQINLDSIYFTKTQVVYCYQYFLEQMPNIYCPKYTSSGILEWREDTAKNLLNVYSFAYYPENTRLWNHSVNVCGLMVRWKALDGSEVHDTDLGIKSFHQTVTLLCDNVMQICYTDWNLPEMMREDEYWYHVCFVYADGTINDCAHSIERVKRNPFHMDQQFSYTNQPSIFFTGLTTDNMLVAYRIEKNRPPELLHSTPIPTREELDSYLTDEKKMVFDAYCLKMQEREVMLKKLDEESVKREQRASPRTRKKIEAERSGFEKYLEETKDDIPEEKIDEIFGVNHQYSVYISRMKSKQMYQGISAFGIAYKKLFYNSNLLDDSSTTNTVSLCAYFDIQKKEFIVLEADKPLSTYVLGNVTDQYLIYFSGLDAEGFGYRNGSIIMRRFTGEVVYTMPLDPDKDCVAFIEHLGVLHILYKDKMDPMTPISTSNSITCYAVSGV